MTEIKIDKGIPVPSLGSPWSGLFKDLELGDSFLIPQDDLDKRGSVAGFRSNLIRLAKIKGITITTRIIKGEGMRVWRIS